VDLQRAAVRKLHASLARRERGQRRKGAIPKRKRPNPQGVLCSAAAGELTGVFYNKVRINEKYVDRDFHLDRRYKLFIKCLLDTIKDLCKSLGIKPPLFKFGSWVLHYSIYHGKKTKLPLEDGTFEEVANIDVDACEKALLDAFKESLILPDDKHLVRVEHEKFYEKSADRIEFKLIRRNRATQQTVL
jgi:hypothetical protein